MILKLIFTLGSITLIFSLGLLSVSNYLAKRELKQKCPLNLPGFDISRWNMSITEMQNKINNYENLKDISSKLYIEPIHDKEQPLKTLLIRISDFIEKNISKARDYELFITKYGLTSLNNPEYALALGIFLRKGGRISLIIPKIVIQKIIDYKKDEDYKKKQNAIVGSK